MAHKIKSVGGESTFTITESTTDVSLLNDCCDEDWKGARVALFKDAVPRCTASALKEFKSLIPETLKKHRKTLGKDMGFIYSPCIITDKTDKTLDVLELEARAIVAEDDKMVRLFKNYGLKPVAVGVRQVTGAFPSDPTNRILVHVMYVCLVTIKFAEEVLTPLYWRGVHKAELRASEEMKKRSQSNAPSLD